EIEDPPEGEEATHRDEQMRGISLRCRHNEDGGNRRNRERIHERQKGGVDREAADAHEHEEEYRQHHLMSRELRLKHDDTGTAERTAEAEGRDDAPPSPFARLVDGRR